MSQNKFEQLIELFIAEDEQAAKDLFHEIVVEKSRDIYEGLVDEDQVEETAEIEEDEDAVEESEVEESEMDETEAELGGDAADDMIDDIEADEEGLSMEADGEEDEELEDRVVDIEDALDELKAEFEQLMANDDDAGDDAMDMDMDMGDEEGEEGEEEEEMESAFEEAEELVREYAEKAPAPVTGEEGSVNTKEMNTPKKDMPDPKGAQDNIAQGGDESGASAPKADDMGGTTKPDMKKV